MKYEPIGSIYYGQARAMKTTGKIMHSLPADRYMQF